VAYWPCEGFNEGASGPVRRAGPVRPGPGAGDPGRWFALGGGVGGRIGRAGMTEGADGVREGKGREDGGGGGRKERSESHRDASPRVKWRVNEGAGWFYF